MLFDANVRLISHHDLVKITNDRWGKRYFNWVINNSICFARTETDFLKESLWKRKRFRNTIGLCNYIITRIKLQWCGNKMISPLRVFPSIQLNLHVFKHAKYGGGKDQGTWNYRLRILEDRRWYPNFRISIIQCYNILEYEK